MYQNYIENTNTKYERKISEGKSFLLVRVTTNKYHLTSAIQNNNIYMDKLLNFNLINLIYQTNLDNFEKINLNVISEDEARVFLLMKPLFKELGLKQRYICFDIKSIKTEKGISFGLTQNVDYGLQMNDCLNAHMLPIKHILYNFELVGPHKLILNQYISFDPEIGMPSMVEPVFGIIMKAMYKRTKHFIEGL